jgi:hypothetical protein
MRKTYSLSNSLEAEMNIAMDDDDKQQEELSEHELRSIKKELRQMQRQAEGGFLGLLVRV